MRKTIYLLFLLMVLVGASAQNPKTSNKAEAYTVVEKMPQFPGGEDSLNTFIGRNLHYPVIAQENGIQGTVIVRFVVKNDGSIGDVEIVRSLEPPCNKEVIRLVKSMPKWSPGKQNGVAVAVWYTLPVHFHLE